MASRVITINMRKYLSTQPRTRRIKRSMRYLRERIAHYTKTDEANIRISDELNRMMFKHYIKSMKPVKVSVEISEGVAKVGLFKDAAKAAVPAPAQPAKAAAKPKEKAAAKASEAKPEAKAEAKPNTNAARKQKAPAASGGKPAAKPAGEGATQK